MTDFDALGCTECGEIVFEVRRGVTLRRGGTVYELPHIQTFACTSCGHENLTERDKKALEALMGLMEPKEES